MKFLILLLVLHTTLIRDNGQYSQVDPFIKKWIENLKDNNGQGCCALSDGARAEEYQWDIEGDHYKVFIEGEWYIVPSDALINQPNLLGFATVWFYHNDGKVKIRCFLPGSGG